MSNLAITNDEQDQQNVVDTFERNGVIFDIIQEVPKKGKTPLLKDKYGKVQIGPDGKALAGEKLPVLFLNTVRATPQEMIQFYTLDKVKDALAKDLRGLCREFTDRARNAETNTISLAEFKENLARLETIRITKDYINQQLQDINLQITEFSKNQAWLAEESKRIEFFGLIAQQKRWLEELNEKNSSKGSGDNGDVA